MPKYTEAASILTDVVFLDPPDAIYLGYGYSTDGTTAVDLGRPDIWLKADEGVTESSGDIEWVDAVSSLTFDNTTTTNAFSSTTAPTFNSGDSSSNNKPYFEFTNSNQAFLSTPANSILDQGTGAFSIVMYVRFTALTSYTKLISKDDVNSEWALQLHGDTGKVTTKLVGADPISDTLSSDIWYSVEWSKDSGTNTHSIYIDGTQSGTTTVASTDFNDNYGLYLGARNHSTLPYFCNADIAEVLYYNDHELTSSERSAVSDYFEHKYSKSVAGDIAYYPTEADYTAGKSTTKKNIPIGSIVPIAKPYRIRGDKTNGTNMIGLKE